MCSTQPNAPSAATGTFPWNPTTAPPVILAIGMNFASHAKEIGKPLPTEPIVFSKGANSIVASGSPIVLPPDEPKVDYEGELAVIIGPKPCKDVSVEEALSCVWGYCVANDVSGRSWQFDRFNGGQWVRSKSFDTFLPLGPAMVDASQVPDPQSLQITTKLNGEVVQDGSTQDMVFSVAELISSLSQSTTLLPGTVILTGTPKGVGHSKTPPRYLRDGDVVTISISGVGEITNAVVSGVKSNGKRPFSEVERSNT